jgi:hypothetical protein
VTTFAPFIGSTLGRCFSIYRTFTDTSNDTKVEILITNIKAAVKREYESSPRSYPNVSDCDMLDKLAADTVEILARMNFPKNMLKWVVR